jgi:predicted site-specific integrase-resolvase
MNSDMIALEKWLEEIGRTPTTAWRWRRKGFLHVINICGRLYVSREEVARFMTRAASGEFALTRTPPRRAA